MTEKWEEEKLRPIIFEILHLERKNLRNKAKTDVKMSEEIQSLLIDYSRKM